MENRAEKGLILRIVVFDFSYDRYTSPNNLAYSLNHGDILHADWQHQ